MHRYRHVMVFVLALAGLAPQVSSSTQSRGEYVCPPCDCGQDDRHFDAPGICPVCNMRLVPRSSAQEAAAGQPRTRVAILIFDGVQIIDYAAPYEVMGQAGYEVFTVAADARPVTTAMGMTVTPRYSFADHPQPDVLLLPGGNVDPHLQNAAVMQWIRTNAAAARHVLSVCNGAFFLSSAGLLDGLTATTFYDLIDALESRTPKATIVRDRRFVDNGKIVTTAGLSSGIDGSLHVIAKISGPARAQMVALNMEYDWKADGNYARASFADRHIRNVFGRNLQLELPAGARARVESTAGDLNAWVTVWRVQPSSPLAELSHAIQSRLQEQGKWTQVTTANTPAQSAWTFTQGGERWQGDLRISDIAGGDRRVELRVSRSSPPAAADRVVEVSGAWMRESMQGRPTAGYVRIVNRSAKVIQLTGAQSPAAGVIELHRVTMSAGMMRMEPVDTIGVPAGGEVELAPGGLHLMFLNTAQPLTKGQRIPVTLQFANGVTQQAIFEVRDAGTM